MRHNINALAMRLLLDIPSQFRSTLFDGRGGGDGGSDDVDVVGGQGFGDAAPVVDPREEFPGDVEFVEAEEAVGEHDGVAGGSVGAAEGGVVVYDLAAEIGEAGVGDVAMMGVDGREPGVGEGWALRARCVRYGWEMRRPLEAIRVRVKFRPTF